MEQPPGSLDAQDLSAFSIPTLIDLTRTGEASVLNASSPDALQMLKSPGCYPNPAASSPGLPPSDVTCQSGDPSRPVDAFSHTTVTLSYVSRSHRYPPPDSSPLYGMPPAGKFSLPLLSDSDQGLGETGFASDQHYLERDEGPVRLTARSLSQAQVQRGDNGAVCVVEEHHACNGLAPSVEEHGCSRSLLGGQGLANGQHRSCSSSGCTDSLDAVVGEDDTRGRSEVPAARDPRSPSRGPRCPLEEPVSPSAASLDGVEGAFDLPQASSSPSARDAHLDRAEEATRVALKTGGAAGDSSKHERTATGPVIDLTEDVSEDEPKTAVPHMNGDAEALRGGSKGKTLPLRSGRGVRLEAIVMSINSSRYKVSGCIRANRKSSASQSTASDCILASPKRNDVGIRRRSAVAAPGVKAVKHKAGGKRDDTDPCEDSTSASETLGDSSKCHGGATPPRPQNAPEDASLPSPSPRTSPAKSNPRTSSQSSPRSPVHKNCVSPSRPDASVEAHAARLSPPPPLNSPKTSRGKGIKTSPAGKTKSSRAPKRKRKDGKRGQASSMFSPKEPEIKLRYVTYKEEKRDSRSNSFSPFVRVERRPSPPSPCTVFNYPDEAAAQRKPGPQPQAHPSGFMSATVPSTSCLQLGRVSVHAQHRRSLICSLCGRSANAMDLGDLHGPYYPEGYRPSSGTPADASGLKADGDDYSDSDSSSGSVGRSRGRKCAGPPAPWPFRTGAQLKQRGLLGGHRWNSDRTGGPAAKQARLDGGGSAAGTQDWYSPPVLPLDPGEYWLHEDCGVWTAGVFLVKGKVYGLEEAVRAAQETVRMHFKPVM